MLAKRCAEYRGTIDEWRKLVWKLVWKSGRQQGELQSDGGGAEINVGQKLSRQTITG